MIDVRGCERKPGRFAMRTMFHMTNDSGVFRTRRELEEKERAYPIGGKPFSQRNRRWLPLYEGR